MTGPELAPTLQAACRRWGPQPALVHRGRTLTYTQLWERATALAAAYRSLGVGPGDRVVVQLPVCPEHVIAAAAAWACGAVHVGGDRDLTGRELAELIARTRAAAVVVHPPPELDDPTAVLEAVATARPAAVRIVHDHESRSGEHRLGDLLAGAPEAPSHPDGPPGTALLLLTSGTTGTPKLVPETLPALWAKMEFFHGAVGCGPDDVHLMYLPIAHVFGLKLTLMGLASGGRVVLVDRFSPRAALRLIDDQRVSVLPGTPTHLRLLLDALDGQRVTVDSLRWAISAAAPMPSGLYDELSGRLGVELLYVYGCSEGFLVQTTDPDEIRQGAVGREVFTGPASAPPDGTVAVLDPDGDEPVPAGETGEIAFGAHRPVDYWDRPPGGADGWYRTGDLGRLDECGLLHVSGRLKELVNRGGLKVAPREIEAILERHPAVADCAVVPSPDPVLGEAICACVVPAGDGVPGLTELRDDLRGQLARHKLPDELCPVEAVPRSAVGKIDRNELVRRVAGSDLPRERLRPRRPTDATG